MDIVLRSFEYSLDYLREQVADVSSADIVAQPHGLTNHPAWVIGHLTYSCQGIGGVVGLASWLPDDWAEKFGTGSEPVNDASAYYTKSELIATLDDAQSRIVTAVRRLDSTVLESELPESPCRTMLPTIQAAITQILVAHTANHVGQVTVWRHLMGLQPVTRPFL